MTATKALTYFLDLLDANANSYKAFQLLKEHIAELERKREKSKLPVSAASNVVPLTMPVPIVDNDLVEREILLQFRH